MNEPTIEHVAKEGLDSLTRSGEEAEKSLEGGSDVPAKIGKFAEQTTEATTAGIAKVFNVAEHTLKANAQALTESGTASTAALEKLTAACQEVATNNAKKLNAVMQAFAAVRNPVDFVQMQQKLIHDGVNDAVRDTQHLAALTAAVFMSAFEPVRHRIQTDQTPAN